MAPAGATLGSHGRPEQQIASSTQTHCLGGVAKQAGSMAWEHTVWPSAWLFG